MSHPQEAIDEADPFRQLSRRALVTNRRRAAELAAVVADLAAHRDRTASDDPALAAHRDLAASLSHEIVGSAGTFGYAEVSDLARRMEVLLSTGTWDADELVRAAAQIGRALERPPSPDE